MTAPRPGDISSLESWLSAMEARAKAATPGNRTVVYAGSADRAECAHIEFGDDRDVILVDRRRSFDDPAPDAAYIASLSPDVVSAMLECVRAAENERLRFYDGNDSDHAAAMIELERALARLTEIVAREGGADG